MKDHQLATAVERLSHERAIKNLSSGAGNRTEWAGKAASSNLEHLSRSEAQKTLVEAGNGAGMGIVSSATYWNDSRRYSRDRRKVRRPGDSSITLIMGMLIGGILRQRPVLRCESGRAIARLRFSHCGRPSGSRNRSGSRRQNIRRFGISRGDSRASGSRRRGARRGRSRDDSGMDPRRRIVGRATDCRRFSIALWLAWLSRSFD